jgi:hypothetical protein
MEADDLTFGLLVAMVVMGGISLAYDLNYHSLDSDWRCTTFARTESTLPVTEGCVQYTKEPRKP